MKCGRKDCPNVGEWYPTLLLRPRNYKGEPMRMLVDVAICEEHKTPSADVYITDEFWKAIMMLCDEHKRTYPHRSLTQVEYSLAKGVER